MVTIPDVIIEEELNNREYFYDTNKDKKTNCVTDDGGTLTLTKWCKGEHEWLFAVDATVAMALQ